MSSSQPPFKDMAPSWPPGKKVYIEKEKSIEIKFECLLEKSCQDLKII